MWSVALDSPSLSVVYKDSTVVKVNRVEVTLDDGQVLGLSPVEALATGDDSGWRYRYQDLLEVDLWWRQDGQHLLLGVSARITVGISWPHARFDPLAAIRLSLNVGAYDGLCGHYLYNNWWTRPHFDQALASLPERTQSLLLSRPAGEYGHFLGFCDSAARGVLQGTVQGLVLQVSPWQAGLRHFTGGVLVIGCGDDPYQLMSDSVAVGRRQLPCYSRPREQRKMPALFDYLGWCSWDACYLEVSEQAVLAKAEEFREKGIPVCWMLVDDGWSEESQRRLLSFQEDRTKFPSGLRGLKATLTQQYGIPWLGVWHALTGQWEGIDRQARLPSGLYDTLETLDEQRLLPPSQAVAAARFWQSWHGYLADQGVDFIKVDVQSNLAGHYRYRSGPGALAQTVHQALEASAAMHFNGQIINCMGMAAEQLWSRPVSALSRNSDDFFPNQPNNLREHALQNAYNALYHDGFHAGDWDMWWSEHEQADSHALLRMLSGGPIYTSDPLGKTCASRLLQLVLNDGRVLRCDLQGRPVREQLCSNPLAADQPLILWNRMGSVGVLGCFHISERQDNLTAGVCAAQVEGLEGDHFIAMVPGQEILQRVARNEPVSVTLAPGQGQAVFFYPDSALSCLGLLDKRLPAFAIRRQWQTDPDVLRVCLAQGGRIGLYSRQRVCGITVNGQSLDWVQRGSRVELDCRTDGPVELEIRVDATP